MYNPDSKPVMLVKHCHQIPPKKRVFPAMASEKFDGVFAFVLPDGRVFSRTGKECFSLARIGADVKAANDSAQVAGLNTHVLIGEVYTPGWPVEDISGSFRRKSKQYTEAEFIIHDAIQYTSFQIGYSKVPYVHRWKIAQWFAQNLGYKVIEQTVVDSEQDAVGMASDIIDRGGEGVVLRNPDGEWWAGKRNADLTKIKQEETVDLRVVGIETGKGKYSHTVGTLLVEFNGGVQRISGMTDEQRNDWYVHEYKIVGKIVEVQYMCLTTDGWMREPRFKRIRYDKDVADNEGEDLCF